MNKFRLLKVMSTSFGKVAIFDAGYEIPLKNDIIRIEDADYIVKQSLHMSGSSSIDQIALVVEQI